MYVTLQVQHVIESSLQCIDDMLSLPKGIFLKPLIFAFSLIVKKMSSPNLNNTIWYLPRMYVYVLILDKNLTKYMFLEQKQNVSFNH